MSSPQFPILIIFDDGDSEIIETADQLLTKLDSLDSTDPSVLVRDQAGRPVRVRIVGGEVRQLEVDTTEPVREGPK